MSGQDLKAEKLASALQKYSYSPTRSSLARNASKPDGGQVTTVGGPSNPSPINGAAANGGPSRHRSSSSVTPSKRSQGKRKSTSDADDDEYVSEPRSSPLTPTNGKAKVRKTAGSGKKPRPYAGPEVYAHLKPVPDHMDVGIDIIFCGINPGRRSSTAGHHFAHPTNKFWRALHLSGLTDRLYAPAEDELLPERFKYGLTNLCGRPTAEQSELSTLEMKLSVLPFTIKLLRFRPRIVCFVGKKIWDIYESVTIKTAIPSSSNGGEGELGKVKEEVEDELLVKVEEDEISPAKGTPDRAKRKRAPPTPKSKVAFDWTKPRALRLPLAPPPPLALLKDVKPELENGGEEGREHCYFWVVPNTSGLERTPLSEQVVLFSHLKAFSDSLRAGQPPNGDFWDIDLSGVERTSEAIASGSSLPEVPKR